MVICPRCGANDSSTCICPAGPRPVYAVVPPFASISSSPSFLSSKDTRLSVEQELAQARQKVILLEAKLKEVETQTVYHLRTGKCIMIPPKDVFDDWRIFYITDDNDVRYLESRRLKADDEMPPGCVLPLVITGIVQMEKNGLISRYRLLFAGTGSSNCIFHVPPTSPLYEVLMKNCTPEKPPSPPPTPPSHTPGSPLYNPSSP